MININQIKKSTAEVLSLVKSIEYFLFVHDTVLIVNLIF